MSAKPKTTIPDEATYRALVESLAMLADASNQFAALDARVQQETAAVVDAVRDEYSILQTEISEQEATIKRIATQHPEWFETVKTLKTPYGSVASRRSTKLEVENEELTIALIERMGPKREMYLRKRNFLNLEALETLNDRQLKRLKIERVTSDKLTVTPAKLDLGKAVKKAAEAATAEV